MNARKAADCLFGWVLAAQVHADVWQGEVGGAPVVMEWSVDEQGEAEGRYFYRQRHSDIALTGKRDAQGVLRLGENLSADEARVDLVLRPAGAGWAGEWRGPQAKRALPVRLKLLALAGEGGADAGGEMDDYNRARLADLRLKPAGKQHFQGYRLAWWVEPVSKIRWFRLESGYPADAMARLNRILEKRQWREIVDAFECVAGARGSGLGAYEQTVIPHWFTPRVMSLSVETGAFCGGAHPDFGDAPLNLAVASGRLLHLEDVLWLGRGKPARDENGQLLDSRYEQKVLQPWLADVFGRLYPREMDNEEGGDCDYRNPEVWSPDTWYLTPQGIQIGAFFPRVEKACDNPAWSLLPWALARKHPGVLTPRLP
ncbi:hypothetical protein [Chromobacterium sp. IIBBL 290-4]|uniref:hypothetical protein n=1 Tax=Chromobacterium sp. IIBBL 290-4 TaxID=2953890 RepID=UPI0020B7A899|nr:hypothetical protein [Chromobacterium sp. IIBBL 290-4]UTH76174.1 hypothetical protein NKT35_08765 [Chromobacterium sp. IIBBL 290-4]